MRFLVEAFAAGGQRLKSHTITADASDEAIQVMRGWEPDAKNITAEPRHGDECQLTCEHCRHDGQSCESRACCWCGACKDGEGQYDVRCTCV